MKKMLITITLVLLAGISILSNNRKYEIDEKIRIKVISRQSEDPSLSFQEEKQKVMENYPDRRLYAFGQSAFPVGATIIIVIPAVCTYLKRNEKNK